MRLGEARRRGAPAAEAQSVGQQDGMSIDTSGSWWVGSEPGDLQEYLVSLTSDQGGYPVERFRLAECACGSNVFRVCADPNEGVAQRICARCTASCFICDSEEFYSEADPEEWCCVKCHTRDANVGVGFSLRESQEDIRWLYLGVRCASCGVLGCFADWKIDYSPSLHLLQRV